MNRQSISVQALLARVESEIEIADGRSARLCRDQIGNYWIVDESERVMSLHEFAGVCRSAARALCWQQRREWRDRIVAKVREAFARTVSGRSQRQVAAKASQA